MKAYCQIRPQPHYRSEAFVAGLEAAGYQVSAAPPPAAIGKDDVLVIWNRYWHTHELALRFEAAGARVLVAENGYIGADRDGIQFYALALGGHNGSGRWQVGSNDRLRALNLDIRPFQDNPDGHILVCGQRGIGSPSMASPRDWHLDCARRIKALTKREIRVRYHPEDKNRPRAPERSLDEDLRGAYACVVWSSGSGVKALVQGIPVCHEAPHWVCEAAAPRGIDGIEQSGVIETWKAEVNRLIGLNDMAWAQWSVAEIASGDPFKQLLP